MIIIPVREGENIDRALKRYKRKFEKTGRMKESRNRKQFNKKVNYVAEHFKKPSINNIFKSKRKIIKFHLFLY